MPGKLSHCKMQPATRDANLRSLIERWSAKMKQRDARALSACMVVEIWRYGADYVKTWLNHKAIK